MNQQPELPIDPPAGSADEHYRAKCFEDLRLRIGEIVPLAEKIGPSLNNRVSERDAVDATMYTLVELVAAVLDNTVTTWQQEC